MTGPGSLERQHTLAAAVARYDELRARDLLASTAAGVDEDWPGAAPLPRQEALELLARKAGYGRQLTVRSARAAGASWSQIGQASARASSPRGKHTAGGSTSRPSSTGGSGTRAWTSGRQRRPARWPEGLTKIV
jgi:hypothetical protein